MDYKIKKNNETLLDSAILLYISAIDDACAIRELEVVSQSHEVIHRKDYDKELDYFIALTNYIIANIY